MTHEEKAKQIVDSFRAWVQGFTGSELQTNCAKQCALIYVDGIVYEMEERKMHVADECEDTIQVAIDYWKTVKSIIEKL